MHRPGCEKFGEGMPRIAWLGCLQSFHERKPSTRFRWVRSMLGTWNMLFMFPWADLPKRITLGPDEVRSDPSAFVSGLPGTVPFTSCACRNLPCRLLGDPLRDAIHWYGERVSGCAGWAFHLITKWVDLVARTQRVVGAASDRPLYGPPGHHGEVLQIFACARCAWAREMGKDMENNRLSLP